MKERMKNYKLAIFLVLYVIFTITCGCLSWVFTEYGVLLFRIWYLITAAIWLGLAIVAIVLFVRLCRLNKLRNELKKLENEINHRKE